MSIDRFGTAGFTWWDKLGINPDIDTTTVPEDVWPGGGLYPWPAAAVATTIVSDSANDAAAGTGCQTVRVIGILSSGLEATEIVSLNGVTPVTLANQYKRINRATCLAAGSGGANAGTITIKHSSTVIAQIQPGYGSTKMAIFTIPTNYSVGFLTSYYFSLLGGSTSYAQVGIYARESPTSCWILHEITELQAQGSSYFHHEMQGPLELSPGADIRGSVSVVGANNTVISCGLEFALK